jgi:hypothetical protein
VADKQSHIPDAEGRPQEYPTTDKPLNGPRRGRVVPIIMLIGFLVVVTLLYLVSSVLTGAD